MVEALPAHCDQRSRRRSRIPNYNLGRIETRQNEGIMLFWEWEQLGPWSEENAIEITNPGKLLHPITKFKIWRDEKLQIFIETASSTLPKRDKDLIEAGTVYENNDFIEFTGFSKVTAKASGIAILSTSTTCTNGETITTQLSSIHTLEYFDGRPDDVELTFDWIANIDMRSYIWPGFTADLVQKVSKRQFGRRNTLELVDISDREGLSSHSIEINACGYRTIVGCTRNKEIEEKLKPGYILYRGNPDDLTRKKIREALSFVLGFPIVHIGHAKFCKNNRRLQLSAREAYSMDGRAFNVHALPPAPICLKIVRMPESQVVEQMVNAYCDSYEELNLKSFSWNYWHAVTAPVHMAPAYFGALIESMQENYIKQKGEKFNTRITSKAGYKEIRKLILNATKDIKLPPDELEMLMDKLNQGNKISLKLKSERFFTEMGLTLGDLEKAAWQRRNDAAHGNQLHDGDYIALIRDTKLLKLILHRIILKRARISDNYVDYYSIGFPIREINDPVDVAFNEN